MLELGRNCSLISVKHTKVIIIIFIVVISASWVVEKLQGKDSGRKSSRCLTPTMSSGAAGIAVHFNRRSDNKSLAVQNLLIIFQMHK